MLLWPHHVLIVRSPPLPYWPVLVRPSTRSVYTALSSRRFAWTSDASVHWINSVLAIGVTGVAFLLIFQSGLNYLLVRVTVPRSLH